MLLAPGERLGLFEILAPIGSGGMGEVYRARDTKLKRDVALKVLPEAFARDPDRMARFQREAEVLASLNHPNIAHIYGVEDRGLVMELVEGETLPCPLPVETALNYARQVAEALEYAHEHGVIHRDLKPANIKVTADGVVKVLDFGLAKAIEEPGSASHDPADSPSPTLTLGHTQVGVIMGTAAYMAPEQAAGAKVDRRADIWSFGAVLYEMLSGKRAFGGDSVADTLATVMKLDPDWTALPRDAPPSIHTLVRRCLAKDRKQRLQAIGEARIVLESPNVGQAPGLPTPTAPLQSRLGWVAAAAAVFALAALAFIHFREPPPPAPQPMMRFSADLGPDAVAGPRITAAISPDGQRLAFVARGVGGREQLATRLLNQAIPTLLTGTDNATDPFFSPDGRWIGFFADGKMKKISVEGGAAVTLSNVENARGASWGEDGNIIVTLGPATGIGLSRVPDAGGAPQTLTKPLLEKGEVSHRWPQILPGGQNVLFTSSAVNGVYDDGFIEVLSLKTGQWKVVQKGGYFGRYVPASNRSGYLVYVHQATLFGVPFDPGRLEVRGTPVPLLEDVAGEQTMAGGQLDFSRNGTLVYLSGKGTGQNWPVVWLDSAGKTQSLYATPGNYVSPRFSPDGKRLALSPGTNDIQVYDLQRDTMTRLTFKTLNNTYPVWTPDGKHIVFRAQSGTGLSLQWIRSDGGGEAQPLLESKTELRPHSFSPDGKRLAFAENNAETGFDTWTLPLDLKDPEHPMPGKPDVFLKTPFLEYEPAFSPDGRWIAYQSSESGLNQIYVRAFPGPGGQWLISGSNSGPLGIHPIWSRNGRELFYETPLDNRIMVVTYSAKGDTFAAEKPRLWSDTRILEPNNIFWNLDLGPDGKRFAVFPRPQADEQKGSVHVTVLLNFLDELRRKVPVSAGSTTSSPP